jgi:hypothetical protein
MPVKPTLPLAEGYKLIIDELSQNSLKKLVTVHNYELQFGVNYTHDVKISCLMYFSQVGYIQCSADNKSFKITAKGIKAWDDYCNRSKDHYDEAFT